MNSSTKMFFVLILVIAGLAAGAYCVKSTFVSPPDNSPSMPSGMMENESSSPSTSDVNPEGEKANAEETMSEAKEKKATGEVVNEKGDRIYLDEKNNAWIAYKNGKTLQLTKNAGTTAGCGSKILSYKNPILSGNSQYALLPLSCDGDAAEIYLKEVSTFTSKKIANGEEASFVSEAGILKIKIGDKIYPNPFTDYCSQAPTSLEIGRDEYPISPAYKHLAFLGQLFTASECGTERLSKIWGVKDGNYTNGIYITLKADPDSQFQVFLKNLGFSCAEMAPVGQCREWMTQQQDIPLDTLLPLKDYADRIKSDDCIFCG